MSTVPSVAAPSAIELDRRRFRKRQTTRSVLISLVSTLVVAVLAWVFVINTPGWARVQQTFLDPAVAVQAWPRVFDGLLLNIRVLIFSAIGVLIVSILLATLRTLRGPIFFPLRALAAGYTDLFRGMPLLIVLYLVGFGLPGENAHAPNEWISVENFETGMRAMARLYDEYGRG